MLCYELEEIILRKLIKLYTTSNDLKYYKFRLVSHYWKNTIEDYICNNDMNPRNSIFSRGNYRYNDDIIRICKRGGLVNIKWIMKNQINFNNNHVIILTHYNKSLELEEIFKDPLQTYNIHLTKKYYYLYNKSLADILDMYDVKGIYTKSNGILTDSDMDNEILNIYEKTDPLFIAVFNGNIRLINILLQNGYSNLIRCAKLSIIYNNYEMATYLIVRLLSNTPIVYDRLTPDELYNIINLLIRDKHVKSDTILYYIINSQVQLNYKILRKLYDYSREDKLIDKSDNMFLYSIRRILFTKNNRYIDNVFNLYGLKNIILKLIFFGDIDLCNQIIEYIIQYDNEKILLIYEVYYSLYYYYNVDNTDDNKLYVILDPIHTYMYPIVRTLYNFVNIVMSSKEYNNPYKYISMNDLILIVVFFIGEYKNDSIIRNNTDKDLAELNLVELISELKELKYIINYKECIKISVNFYNKDILLYLVENM